MHDAVHRKIAAKWYSLEVCDISATGKNLFKTKLSLWIHREIPPSVFGWLPAVSLVTIGRSCMVRWSAGENI